LKYTVQMIAYPKYFEGICIKTFCSGWSQYKFAIPGSDSLFIFKFNSAPAPPAIPSLYFCTIHCRRVVVTPHLVSGPPGTPDPRQIYPETANKGDRQRSHCGVARACRTARTLFSLNRIMYLDLGGRSWAKCTIRLRMRATQESPDQIIKTSCTEASSFRIVSDGNGNGIGARFLMTSMQSSLPVISSCRFGETVP